MGGAGRNQGGGDLYTRISIIRIKSCSSANDFVQSEGQARAGRPREGKGVDSGHQVPTSPMSLALGRPLGQPHLRSPPLCSAHPACRGLGWGLGKGRDQDELRCPASGTGTRVTVAEHQGGAGLCGKRVTPVPTLVSKRGCPQLGRGHGGLSSGEGMSPLHSTSVEGKGSACWCGHHPH